ncbi:sulfotransferase [Nocardioides sp. SR21]|uniref:sulfotransferase family protein n=1 Tax=Nocardioides sp. SR21 TaxID=2919501 RepID=UPI001FAA804F|nr:sulfotransferase [Nocardioides sp. SR21]
MESSQRLLFLAGLARSGTTALLHVLNAHPEVAIGMERYKRLLNGQIDLLRPELFDQERFFDFSDGLTNQDPEEAARWGVDYAAIEKKYAAATYVGDKMTTIRFGAVHERLPEARFVFIVRDIDQVASSWDRRAQDDTDVNWPERSDARASVERWNRSLRRIRRAARQYPELTTVVEYARFFGDPEATSLRAVLDSLGLPWTLEVADEFARVHNEYVDSVAGRDRQLSDDVRAFVDELADRGLWRQVNRLAV